jgi:hypothetical protein
MLTSVLGLRPDAPTGRLRLSPALPPWLNRVCLLGLRVGETFLDLGFERRGSHVVWTADVKAGPALEIAEPGA